MSPQVDCPLRVCDEKMYAMLSILLVFSFCFEHELLEYVVAPCDGATCNQ